MRSRKHILERDHARTVGEHIFKQQIRKISRRRDYNRCIRISFFFYSSPVLCFLATLLYDSNILKKMSSDLLLDMPNIVACTIVSGQPNSKKSFLMGLHNIRNVIRSSLRIIRCFTTCGFWQGISPGLPLR